MSPFCSFLHMCEGGSKTNKEGNVSCWPLVPQRLFNVIFPGLKNHTRIPLELHDVHIRGGNLKA